MPGTTYAKSCFFNVTRNWVLRIWSDGCYFITQKTPVKLAGVKSRSENDDEIWRYRNLKILS
ncbi:hypothetical protein VF06_34950 [Nostoc linckia z4]|nr:hypothetical protein VF05_23700 [Nostoc linckia z3]PHJ74321.1 hypothetical protein VF06_34950 [Nostoc linckia z4]PHJ77917.1 hypothetical protein VF07_35625 [Nostoc linckia z6]PHK06284.1 hypothetical protein VF09_25430 [Nostoc linckia z9]PHK08989.1 hypothetical protein VF10_36475 [Nostoc linckia z13]